MKQGLPKLTAILFIMATAFTSCARVADSSTTIANEETETKPYTVTGTAIDGQGNPLKGVKVRAVNHTGYNIFAEATTDSKGKYSLTLSSIGGWNIYAWKEVEYKDQMFHLRLGMQEDTDYDAFSVGTEGAVKNFVWKLSGRIPDRSADYVNGFGYFGGCLRFVNDNGVVPAMPAGTKVTITLKPVDGAKYLDGTDATKTITKTFTIKSTSNQNYAIGDFPVTEYHMSISSEYNGVKKVVFIGANSYNDLREWVEFDFDSSSAGHGSYESGLMTPNEMPYYMGQKQ